MQAGWQHFPHGADLGIRGLGGTLEESFAQAALAMNAAITDLSLIDTHTAVSIHCSAPAPELLLVDWLNALIYEMATRRMLFGRFDIRISGQQLHATAWGDVVDVMHHQPAIEPKGATYTELDVTRQANGQWRAQCVIDV